MHHHGSKNEIGMTCRTYRSY